MKQKMEQPIEQLKSSQKEISHLLASVTDEQDWQPDQNQWSFRYIAAHLATTERDCFQDRIVQITAGEKSYFESYFNTGWDFSQFELMKSLNDWVDIRHAIINQVSVMSEKDLAFSGTHAAFGTITVLDVLQVMLEHDQEHLQALQQMIDEYKMQ